MMFDLCVCVSRAAVAVQVIKAEHVKMLMEEFEISKDKSEYLLRSCHGDVKEAFTSYIKGKLW